MTYATKEALIYVEVPATRLPAELKAAAERMANTFARELGVRQRITVRWFEPLEEGADAQGRKTLTLDGPHNGYFPHDGSYTVWINAKLGAFEQVRTIAHEVKHAHQFQLWGPYNEWEEWWIDEAVREKQAREFAAKRIPAHYAVR